MGGDAAAFNNLFSVPISKSREPDASQEEKIIGIERSKQLSTLTSTFILRRTQALLTNLLPPRTEIVIFCGISSLQKLLYQQLIRSKYMNKILNENSNVLSMIIIMKKLLCHPNMLYYKPQQQIKNNNDDEVADVISSRNEGAEHFDEELQELWKDTLKYFPKDYNHKETHLEYSGKLTVLNGILKESKVIGDRVIIVSNYTSVNPILLLFFCFPALCKRDNILVIYILILYSRYWM